MAPRGLVLLLVLSSCTTSHNRLEGVPGRFEDACGPDDGPAIDLRLFVPDEGPTCDAPPHPGATIDLLVYDAASVVPGAAIVSSEAAPTGVVTLCPGGTMPCGVTQDFTLMLDEVSATTMRGELEYDGGAASFVAERCPSMPTCG